MAEQVDLYSVKDGETLRTLESGLEIIRRAKHEWTPSLVGLTPEKLAKRTGKVWGSKFLPNWTLPTLVEWIERVVREEGWALQPGRAIDTDRSELRAIALVSGTRTRKIKVVCDGRYIHAYPVKE